MTRRINFTVAPNGVYGDLIDVLRYFLLDTKQKFLLKGNSSCTIFIPRYWLQGSNLGPFLFLMRVNDAPSGLKCIDSNFKLSDDDTALFLVMHNIHSTGCHLDNDLKLVTHSVYQRKMIFSLDASEQVEFLKSRRWFRKLRLC